MRDVARDADACAWDAQADASKTAVALISTLNEGQIRFLMLSKQVKGWLQADYLRSAC